MPKRAAEQAQCIHLSCNVSFDVTKIIIQNIFNSSCVITTILVFFSFEVKIIKNRHGPGGNGPQQTLLWRNGPPAPSGGPLCGQFADPIPPLFPTCRRRLVIDADGVEGFGSSSPALSDASGWIGVSPVSSRGRMEAMARALGKPFFCLVDL